MKNKKGFTLIELSVVIVIIGLIVAGIVAGQSLVKQAKIRGVLADFQKYEAAFNSFFLQYDAYPGDMKNASSYWSGVPDGNGNKLLDWQAGTAGTSSEAAIASAHLENAGLIEGNYSLTSHNTATANVAIPSGFSSSSGYVFTSATNVLVAGNETNCGLASVVIKFGNKLSSSNTHISGPVLTTAEVIGIDNKVDDGLPRLGIIAGCNGNLWWNNATGFCVNSTTSPWSYDTTDMDSVYCNLAYRIAK